jgi:hypothetical protein
MEPHRLIPSLPAPLVCFPRGGRVGPHVVQAGDQSGHRYAEDRGDPQEVAVAGLNLAALDALDGPSADACHLGQLFLTDLPGGSEIGDAFTQAAMRVGDAFCQLTALVGDWVLVIARHSSFF